MGPLTVHLVVRDGAYTLCQQVRVPLSNSKPELSTSTSPDRSGREQQSIRMPRIWLGTRQKNGSSLRRARELTPATEAFSSGLVFLRWGHSRG